MAISFYYNIVVLYYAELFPSRAVALGGSVAAFGGSIGSIVVPLILGFIISLNYNHTKILTIQINSDILFAILFALFKYKDNIFLFASRICKII
jgi:MFS family permease